MRIRILILIIGAFVGISNACVLHENCGNISQLVDENLVELPCKDQNLKHFNVNVMKKREYMASESFKFEYGNEILRNETIIPEETFSVYIYLHEIGEDGNSSWINDDIMLYNSKYKGDDVYLIKIDYKNLVKTEEQAEKNAYAIGNHSAEILSWALKYHLQINNGFVYVIGFGIGANIGSLISQRLLQFKGPKVVVILTALDPHIPNPQNQQLSKGFQYPEINISKAQHVIVFHTTTCRNSPVIPACDSTLTVTMGYFDYFINGGSCQTGCSCNDFMCSHRKVLDYFRESRNSKRNILCAIESKNFEEFQKYNNSAATTSGCTWVMSYYDGYSYFSSRRYYLYTNAIPPYGRGMNFSKP